MACTFAIICDHYFAVMRIKKRWLVLKVTTNGPLVPGRLSGMLRTDKWMICTQNPLCKRVTISSYYHSSIKCFFFTLGKVHLIWQGGEDEDIEGGFRKFLDTRRGGSEKNVALGGGLRKSVYFKTNTWHHHTDRMVFNKRNNDLCNSAISRGLQI